MRTIHWLMTGILGLVLAGCAGISTAPTPEARQALAPTGKLRVGLLLGSPTHVIKDAASGEMKGVGFDLGKELARRMGVPFDPLIYPSIPTLLDSGKAGHWDVTFIGVTPGRAKDFDFAPTHLEVEFGYLVPAGSSISTMADVDRPGIRVALQERSGPDAFFSPLLKNAVLVRASSNPGTLELLKSGKADVMGSIKPILFELSKQLPGSRVLDGRPGIDPHAMAMPKGRDPGAAYARKFVENAKSQGLVKAAIERVEMRGALVSTAQ
ncbi:MAG: transporter substrate-binding domain-containing protein [Polaromonas sp.]|uniref:transporter substrate-binding domain-containing protein n=1 Tax=Polaromonas sp. TaxID=1869339 RepID=UPI002735DA22|nr:transporter substrate-binding domain-containing protein [Polaromonas sp.]MDP3797907.1 transporter substrate-binding domain-containing protein [Polaromonas sp.]